MPTPIVVRSSDHELEIPGDFTLAVLGDAGNYLCGARGVKLIGRRLIVQLSESVESKNCIRIDCGDAFLLGEVLGCWHEESTIYAAIELHQAVTRMAVRAPFSVVAPRRPVAVEIRQSA